MSYLRPVLVFGFGLLTILLAACGGGDGDGAPPAASVVTLPSGGDVAGTWTEFCFPNLLDQDSERGVFNVTSATTGTFRFTPTSSLFVSRLPAPSTRLPEKC